MRNKFIEFILTLLTKEKLYCKVVLSIENSKITNMEVKRNFKEEDL